jgi:N-methylhydantoinase A
MRYGEQVFEIDVPLDGVDWNADDLMRQVSDCFHDRHAELFTYALRDQDVVLVNARIAVIGVLAQLPAESLDASGAPAAPKAMRRVYLDDGWREIAVYDLDSLPDGQVLCGPTIVESETTTLLLRARDQATVTPQRWLDIRVGF